MAELTGDNPEQMEALGQLQHYLSDAIAPMIFAQYVDALFDARPELTATQIISWVMSQHRSDEQLATADYLFHAAKKIHLLAELELVPMDLIETFIATLRPALIQACPETDRDGLARDLDNLKLSRDATPAAVGHVYRSGGADAPRSKAERSEAAGASRERGGPAREERGGAQLSTSFIRGLNRVGKLLERVASTAPATAVLPGGQPDTDQALVARIVTEAATGAGDATELHGSLQELQQHGVQVAPGQLIQMLANSLPNWAAPAGESVSLEEPQSSVRAMRRIVAMSKSVGEKAERFHDLVNTAAKEFNAGSLGRSVTMIDLAERMAQNNEVETSVVNTAQSRAAAELDRKRLREFAEDEDTHHLLQRFMKFFPQLSPPELLEELEREESRERRRFILMLLSVQADETRKAALETLNRIVQGEASYPWFFERNVVYLLRTIKRMQDSPLDPEIDVLVPMSELNGPLQVVREAVATLGQMEHPRAVTALAARVSEMEDALLDKRAVPHDAEEIVALLDNVVTMLARSTTREARRCVITHGLKRQPQLGDTSARLAKLAGQDLSDDLKAVDRIIRGLREELPTKLFGLTVKSARKTAAIDGIIRSLTSTDTESVRAIYKELAEGFQGHGFAETAARALANLGSETHVDEEPSAALTGDLLLFGLPNLLQNLSDSQLSGTLTVLDRDGRTAASVMMAGGMMTSAEAGALRGEMVVFQLLEKPVPGRFVFVKVEGDEGTEAAAPGAKAIAPLLFEGIRRYDEFMRAAALAPDDARFTTTGQRPTNVEDELNTEMVKTVWQRALKGETPVKIEEDLPVDSFCVRRLFEHWLTEGSLAVKES